MFSQKERPKYERLLEEELERTLGAMKMTALVDSPEYIKLMNTAENLHKMLNHNQTSPVSKDVLFTIAGNLAGIMLILKHEWANPITSKALGFVIRPRQ